MRLLLLAMLDGMWMNTEDVGSATPSVCFLTLSVTLATDTVGGQLSLSLERVFMDVL